jgi:hypothetical protein
MSTPNQGILVLGAGELGMPILRELSKPHWERSDITVLLRPATITTSNPDKQAEVTEIRNLGIHLLPGDLVASSVSELAKLMTGFHTVIGCTGFVAGRGIQTKLAQAVLEAGIPRYFPWQFGVDYDVIGKGSAQDLFDDQLDVRALLRGQERTEWVIISTGVFTSFLFSPFFRVVDIENGTVHALGSWDNRITVTTVEDIGRLTAKIVHSKPRICNTVLYTGGDTLSYSQLADIVDSVLESKGRKAQRLVWEVPMLQEQLKSDPNDALKKYWVVFAKGRGVSWDLEQTFNKEHNIPVVSARQWAHDNLK